MKIFRLAVQLLILGAVGFAVYYFFFPPPERVIRKNLAGLEERLSENPSGNIARVANVNAIAGYFHPEVSLNLEGFGRGVEMVSGRNELQRLAMAARQAINSIRVEFVNIHVRLDEGAEGARVVLTAMVWLNNQAEPAVQDIKIQFEKVDRDWLIRSIEPVRPVF